MSKYTIKIWQDDDPESPREWDNLGTMACSHRRYRLGDKQLDYDEFWEFIKEEGGKNQFFILPLYLYDHSGITMSTDAFGCPWDSGQVGYIYVSKVDIRKEWGVKRIRPALAKQVYKNLKAEVETYDQYLLGDVWCLTIEKDGEEVDSCCGFYGEKYCREEAEVIVRSYKKSDFRNRIEKLKALIHNHVPLGQREHILGEV